MRFHYRCLLGLLSLGSFPAALAQAPAAPPVAADSATTRPPTKPDKPNFIPLPVVFSTPETGLGFGLAVLPVWRFGADAATRKSNARLLVYYTQQKQSSVQLTHNVFAPGEKFLFTGELSYFDFPILYYGTGGRVTEDDESQIAYKVRIFNQRVLRQVAPKLFVGGVYRLTHLNDVEVEKGKPDGSPSPLLARPAAERTGSTLVSGLGPALLLDTRDNILSAYRGTYLEAAALVNGSALGSEYSFTRFLVDARKYRALDADGKIVLAGQLYGQFHAGRVPFRELANLGGGQNLRGYYEGRYRARQLASAQVEVRRYLFWRFNGVLFGGVGQVGDKVGDFNDSFLKMAGGAGLRFQFNRRDRLNIRVDYGLGRGNSSGLYFSFGEAF